MYDMSNLVILILSKANFYSVLGSAELTYNIQKWLVFV